MCTLFLIKVKNSSGGKGYLKFIPTSDEDIIDWRIESNKF